MEFLKEWNMRNGMLDSRWSQSRAKSQIKKRMICRNENGEKRKETFRGGHMSEVKKGRYIRDEAFPTFQTLVCILQLQLEQIFVQNSFSWRNEGLHNKSHICKKLYSKSFNQKCTFIVSRKTREGNREQSGGRKG